MTPSSINVYDLWPKIIIIGRRVLAELQLYNIYMYMFTCLPAAGSRVLSTPFGIFTSSYVKKKRRRKEQELFPLYLKKKHWVEEVECLLPLVV